MMRAGLLAGVLMVALLAAGCSNNGGDTVEPAPEGPPPPVWLHVSDTSPQAIGLAWTDVSGSEAGLRVERSLSAGNGFAVLDTLAPDTQAYTDTSAIAAETGYYYRVIAYDALGRDGDRSDTVWGVATENQTPLEPHDPIPAENDVAPDGLDALRWSGSDPDGDLVYYDVYFGESRIALNGKCMGDTANVCPIGEELALTRSYFWRVVASDDFGATAISPIWNFGTRIETVELPAGYFFRGDCGHFNPQSPDLYCCPENPWFVERFDIDKYEVSNQLFAQFLQMLLEGNYIHVVEGMALTITGDTLYAEVYPDGDQDSGIRFDPQFGDLGLFMPRPGKENHPVIEITWFGADRYARENGRFLPTEIQWEKAARGTLSTYGDTLMMVDGEERLIGFGFPFPWGNENDPRRFNHLNSGDPFESQVEVSTAPVGFYDGNTHDGYATRSNASTYGVFDLAGNVSEWCLDLYEPYGGGTSNENLRVVKGGGWRSESHWCQTYWRESLLPQRPDNAVGFRTAGRP